MVKNNQDVVTLALGSRLGQGLKVFGNFKTWQS